MKPFNFLKAFGGRIWQSMAGAKIGNSYTSNFTSFLGTGYYTPPGSGHNYAAEAGAIWENSAAWCALTRIILAYFEAELSVQKKIDGKWKTLDNHPAYQVLNGKHSVMDTRQFWTVVLIGVLSGGNGYLKIGFDENGVPNALVGLPHNITCIDNVMNPNVWINRYRYMPSGAPNQFFSPDEIIHFRHLCDITNPRYGVSPFIGALREIVTDNEASSAAAAVLRNAVIIPTFWSPSSWDDASVLTPQMLEEYERRIKQNSGGDNRGNFIMFNTPGDWKSASPNIEQMAFDAVRRIPAQRICACLGVHPMFVGIGYEEKFTDTAMKEATMQSYQNAIIPLWVAMGQQLTEQLMPYYTDDLDNYRFFFDYSRVAALQENVNLLHERMRSDFNAGILTANEVRAEIGRPPVPGGDVLLKPTTAYNNNGDDPDKGTPDENTGKKKGGLRDGREGMSDGRDGMNRQPKDG